MHQHWFKTLKRLPIRYRRPYVARHTSVSWNLMMRRSPLFVAKQHGHAILAMLPVYAAWTEGALPADVAAIRRTVNAPAYAAGNSRIEAESVQKKLFTETCTRTDRFFMGYYPADDAVTLAADLVNDPAFPHQPQRIADHYRWNPRRLNPAITYLRERNVIHVRDALSSAPFVVVGVYATTETRRFMKSRT